MKKIIIACLSLMMSTSLMAQNYTASFYDELESPYSPFLPAPFDIVIQDSVVIMGKKQASIALKVAIIKHVEENITVYNFLKYVRVSCWDPRPYIDKNGNIQLYSGTPGLYYYLEDINGIRSQSMFYPLELREYCEKRVVRVDTSRMKINVSWNPPESHEKLASLSKDTTYWVVYPTIGDDYDDKYFRKHILPKGNEFYLTLYYVFPRRSLHVQEKLLVVTSNKVKLIIK